MGDCRRDWLLHRCVPASEHATILITRACSPPSSSRIYMSKPRKSRGRRKHLLWLIPLLLILGGAAYKFFRPQDDRIAIQVEKAARRDITEIVVANGRIQPVTQV